MNETKTKPVIETWPVLREAVKVWRETKKRQITGALNRDGGFCALGVLGRSYRDAETKFGIQYDDSPSPINCPSCGKPRPSSQGLITHWNDYHHFTFKEIADLAEAYPHLVFKEVP